MTRAHTTAVEERAVTLLGAGVSPEQAAAALGVTPSRISQLLSDEFFAGKVSDLKFESLQKHNSRDNKYDTLEDKVLEKLEKTLPMMYKPGEVLKTLQVLNGAKRRGQSSPDQVVNQQNIVTLILPTVVTQQFATNVNNQVIKAGEQDLVTLSSNQLLEQIENTDDRTNHIIETPQTGDS